ncbi:redoxin family protein [Phenylobacterium sp.]|jgi:mono/diheme cytochrome c family protein|uniref:redoxin family protein n=1 Tax=Phenylobacterium sp. TaxID=1871053 RepID=UPI002F92086C
MVTYRLAALLGSAALLAGCAANEGAPNALALVTDTATTAPAHVGNFMLVDQNLVAHELYRMGSGPAVVIVTQANGDSVIRASAAQVNRLAETYGPKGVEVVMLNPTAKDTLEGVQAEVQKAGFKVPVMMDNNQLIGESLGVTRSAEAVVINPRTWQVVYRGALGGAPDAIDALVAGRPVSVAGAASKGAPIAFAKRNSGKLTYVKDVAPILEARCVACHSPGGIGPFAMTSYDMVKGFAPMIREVIRTDRMPPYAADPRVGHFSDSKNLTPAEIKTLVHWVEAGAPRGEGSDPLAVKKIAAPEWPLGKPDLILKVPSYKVPASGTVDYQRPFTVNTETEGRWIRATAVKPGDRRAVHHLLSGWMKEAPKNGVSSEGNWRNSVGRYAVGSEADVYTGDVGTYLPPGGAVGFQMHYTPYGKEAVDASEVGIYFRKDPPKYIMRQVAISDPTITIPPNTAYHEEQAYLEFPKEALLYSAFVHAHYRATASDLWIQYADGKKKLLLSMPRYDFNWQRAYTFAEPVKVPAGARLIARYWYDNSKRNPANPDPKIQVTWGEQSHEEMLFTQIEFRWMDETAAQQIDSDARFQDTRLLGAMDDNLDGKVQKAELRGQFGKNLAPRFEMIDANKDGAIDKLEMNEAMKAMQSQRRRAEASPAAAAGR